jgi:hypothetical protein
LSSEGRNGGVDIAVGVEKAAAMPDMIVPE